MPRANGVRSARPVRLVLESGLVFDDAARLLREKFEAWPWEVYDGDPPRNPNRVSKRDLARPYKLGARTPKWAYAELLAKQGRAINRVLRRLPRAPIERLDLARWKPDVVELFGLAVRKHVGLAGATKLLAPFRPSLIPIIDSWISDYYWWATSIGSPRKFHELRRLADRPAEYAFAVLELMQVDVRGAAMALQRCRAAVGRVAWSGASNLRLVESLLWYYYARNPAQATASSPA